MNCSMGDASFGNLDSQNIKSKMYVPGVGKIIFFLFLVAVVVIEFMKKLNLKLIKKK